MCEKVKIGGSLLVVEDEIILLKLLEYQLSKQYDVRTAQNGEEALLLVQELPPDLIISDIMMPKMDGLTMLCILKESHGTRDIPVIMLSAKKDEATILKANRIGASEFLTKPFDLIHLVDTIKRYLV